MSEHCSPTFAKLAQSLGFSCDTAGGPVEVRNPFALENWTLPVLEATVVVGAVVALVYAIIRLRRHGDATNLTIWFGAIAYLFIIEPPLYFPAAFGIADDRSHLVGEDRGKGRQVAGAVVLDAEQPSYRRLALGLGIQIAHQKACARTVGFGS